MAYAGGKGEGHDHEQLLALGWLACGQAIQVLAKNHGLDGQDVRVSCTIAIEKDEFSFGFKAEVKHSIPGADGPKRQAVMEAYSRAKCNNVPVTLTVA